MQSFSLTKCPEIFKRTNFKNLWAYVAIAFNKVDLERLKLVGPDRLCAEWILKNGGGIAFTKCPGKYLRDYNSLPPDNITVAIKEIDATASSIMKIGLSHFRNCNHIDTVILESCQHLENDSLEGLIHLKNTLKCLHISNCCNFNDTTFAVLKDLKNLSILKIENFEQIKNLSQIAEHLRCHLTNCEITIK